MSRRSIRPLVIRAPNHLGDVVMALPAIRAAGQADVIVARWLVPLLEMARRSDPQSGIAEILPLDRGWRGLLRAAARLRALRYVQGVLLTPSFSSALLFRLAGVRERRGTPSDGRKRLLTDPVPLTAGEGLHRAALYEALVTDTRPSRPPLPRLRVGEAERSEWHALVARDDAPLVGVFPGSNSSSRRWDPERFEALVRRLRRRHFRVAVFGGPNERALTREVAGRHGIDLGGRTGINVLAAGLADCALLVTNDSGPMHLAAAVGTPVVALFGPGDPAATGPLGDVHTVVRAAWLPCIACVKNECPRSGSGYRLPYADRECMRLITVAHAEAVVIDRLSTRT